MMKFRNVFIFLLTGGLLFSNSAWLPGKGNGTLEALVFYESSDSVWAGTRKVNRSEQTQMTETLLVDYGVTENLAIDLALGYTKSKFRGMTNSGRSDTKIGARWRIYDEFSNLESYFPTVTVRAIGVLAGNYEDNLSFSAGDGASGGGAGLYLGKVIGANTGVWASIEYMLFNELLPDRLTVDLGVYRDVADLFTVWGKYRYSVSQGGSDLGVRGFTFQGLNEDEELFEVGIRKDFRTYYSLSFFMAWTLDGRNTVDKEVYGVSLGRSF